MGGGERFSKGTQGLASRVRCHSDHDDRWGKLLDLMIENEIGVEKLWAEFLKIDHAE